MSLRPIIAVSVSAWIALLPGLSGCSGEQKRVAEQRAPTQTASPKASRPTLDDELRARYADCRVGQYVVLADFEQPFTPFGVRDEPPPRPDVNAEDRTVENPAAEEPSTQPAANLTTFVTSFNYATANIAWPPTPPATQPSSVPDEQTWLAFPASAAATGKRSLGWRVRAGNDSLRIGQLAKTDWTDYALLNISIHSPEDDVPIDIELWGSDPRGARHSMGGINLAKGWNLIRLDLSTVNAVDLADIRAIWLVYRPMMEKPMWIRRNVPGQHVGDANPDGERSFVRPADPAAPADALLIDDVLLIDNTRWLLGSGDQLAGQLFARWRGRSLEAGIAGSHAISLRTGPIERLTDISTSGRPILVASHVGPSSDSAGAEQVEIVRSAPPGEMTVFPHLSDHHFDHLFNKPGHVRVLECNPLRVVVEASWPMTGSEALTQREEPSGSKESFSEAKVWRYWIYAGGQIHVAARLRADVPGAVGTAIFFRAGVGEGLDGENVLADPDGRWVISAGRPIGNEPPLAIGVSQPLHDDVEFLGISGGDARWLIPRSDQPRAVAQRVEISRGTADHAHGEAMHAAVTKPLLRTVSLGEIAADQAWDVDRDGFAEMEGVYNFRLVDDRLRVRLAVPNQAAAANVVYSDVVIRVVGVPADRATYVAVDSQPLAGVLNLARDANGQLLIRLPRPLISEADVDIRVLGDD